MMYHTVKRPTDSETKQASSRRRLSRMALYVGNK